MNWNWGMISAISSAFMALVILVAAIIAVLQLKEISKTRKVNTFMKLSEYLQREEIREARRVLIGILGKDYKGWSKEEVEAAEKACHTYDYAGSMECKKFIEVGLVASEWRDSIIKCWEAAKPMITEYRRTRRKDFWQHFEKLYERAKKIETAEVAT